MAGLTLDAGALIAYERGEEHVREILAVAYARGLVPTIPAVALAEVWRGDGKDARVARLLKACSIEALDERLARAAGRLRRATPGASTIDACIAVGVSQRVDAIATSDPNDLRTLLGRSSRSRHTVTQTRAMQLSNESDITRAASLKPILSQWRPGSREKRYRSVTGCRGRRQARSVVCCQRRATALVPCSRAVG